MLYISSTVKPVLSSYLKIEKTKVLKTGGRLMQVESIADAPRGAFCNTFDLHGLKNNFWSSFEWPLKTGFTVIMCCFLKILFIYANTEDPNEMTHSAVFHLGLHY